MQQTRIEEDSGLEISIPWNANTARSFGLALLVNALLLWLFINYADISIEARQHVRPDRVPTLIVFGLGDGVKPSGGNLAAEGKKRAGQEQAAPLEDASRAPAEVDKVDNANNSEHPNARPNVVKQTRAATSSPEDDAREGKRDLGDVGSASARDARGLGDFGGGRGRGDGFGDVEWGGGGNRIVLQKKLPDYARGVNRSVEVRLQFVVSPDGRVTKVLPIRQGEPALASRAVRALKQWRFGPIDEDKEMSGYITFTFRI